ncbi:MAG TPA: acyl-CoA dehydrogenase family protein [Candidatus Acidoferrales bacterium]|nr:acyl-CoA dehydrogenase family protein [Candidatus Acidoferrales bacterium]
MALLDAVGSPLAFLQSMLPVIPHAELLAAEQEWWKADGVAISGAIDRAGTPWLRMFDRSGKRTDEILYPPEYQTMLWQGYRSGVVWRALEEKSLLTTYLLMYVISFYDPGICCPYTVSLGTAVSLAKYGSRESQTRFLPPLLRKDNGVWQGATWMTELGGGSDLGANVKTMARPTADGWLLTGDKYFASNAAAELAVVAARPEKAPPGVRGLALFLVPRYRRDGSLNRFIRRLKDKIGTRSVPTGEIELRDSEAYLLGLPDSGIYLILEVLNLSRVANSVVSVALAQRALADALAFAKCRTAFGKRIVDHALLRHQFEASLRSLRSAFALAWESVRLLDEVRMERPPYSERYHFFRLVAHLAKYWTAELAVDTAKWAMEVHGGLGVLGEYDAERWLREAMILAIWEGTSHRQILDGLEVMERKQAHKILFARLAEIAQTEELQQLESDVQQLLKQLPDRKEAEAEALFRRLAILSADHLSRKHLE